MYSQTMIFHGDYMHKQHIQEEHEKRLKLYKEGLSDYKISFICKYSRSVILRWRNKNGLPKNNTRGRKSKTV